MRGLADPTGCKVARTGHGPQSERRPIPFRPARRQRDRLLTGEASCKGYDHRSCRRDCRRRGITPRIARRGVEGSRRLGRHRWKVERTLAWMARFRRLTVRYERREDIHLAFTMLAAALICTKQIRRLC